MNTTQRIRLSLVGLLLLLSAGIYAQSPVHIIVMHTNDIHGHLLPDSSGGGSAMLATIVRKIQPDLMLDAGDMFTGAMVSDRFLGEPVIDVMNAIGYDAAVVGNHEFDYGVDVLRMRAQQANFPLLSANTLSVDEVHEAAIFNAQGVRIAVIGATTTEAERTAHPKYMKDVEMIDVVRSVEEALSKVRDRVDFAILLSHISSEEEVRVARAFPELRLIIGGHDHTALQAPLKIGNTTIVRSGSHGLFVGRVDLMFDFQEGSPRIQSQLIPVRDVEPDPEIVRVLAPYEQKIAEDMSRVLGETRGELTRSLSEESHVSNLVADAIRWKSGAEIVLLNVGQQRIPIPKGPITGRKLFELLPFQSTLVTMQMSGGQIKKILSQSLMSISGVRLRLDPRKPVGERLSWIRLDNGKQIDDRQLYTVATNDYLLAGGDGFKEFASGLNVEDTGIIVREAVAEYVVKLGTISPKLDGRIRILR